MQRQSSSIAYNHPVQIAEGIWWIGFHDVASDLHCNPYLIVDGDEAVVIDGGSRPDFPVVMMKVFQTGVEPASIRSLIYHHYDPDLCGSMSNFEDIIGGASLRIISHHENHSFIRHYGAVSPLDSLDDIGHRFHFSSGRTLEFITTPYAHSGGSFVTWDSSTGTLFSSDLFGSYAVEWDLYLTLAEECGSCTDYDHCPNKRPFCPIPDILQFHRVMMNSNSCLRYSLRKLRTLPIGILAPQHGSVVTNPHHIAILFDKLLHLEDVGIDGIRLRERIAKRSAHDSRELPPGKDAQ